jgi:integrase/recombinase XerD
MKTLEHALENYLSTRRALGFRLNENERLLTQFVGFVKMKQSDYITVEMALDFATNCRATPTRWAKRWGIIRLFCRYVHAMDSTTPLLPDRVFRRSDSRATPYIFSENDIYRLVEACKTITLGKLRNATYSTLLGLIAVTGMRVGEAMKLEDRDVDWAEHILTIREAKFKSRQVVLHSSNRIGETEGRR